MAIVVRDLTYVHPGGGPLFDNVSFKVGDGQHAGLVGANGVGKSTLLRCIAGTAAPTSGTTQADGALALMPQQIGEAGDARTVRDLMISAAPPAVAQSGEKLVAAERAFAERPDDERVAIELGAAISRWGELGGYGHEAEWEECTQAVLRQDWATASERPLTQLSGGEQKRLVLEALLRSTSDALLLDEPDNFLDVRGKRWLEERVRGSSKTILMISHDREVLASAVGAIVTLETGGAWVHGGSFATYEEARAARQARLASDTRAWQEEERRLHKHFRWMKQRAATNSDMAAAARAAETRWRRFVDDGPPPPPARTQRIRMRLAAGSSGRRAALGERLELSGLTDPFSFEIGFGERVAVVGPNGAGKSHFLRLLAGVPVEHSGLLRLGEKTVSGLFEQMHAHPEWVGRTLVDVLAATRLSNEQAMGGLARYELQDAAWQSFDTLSGGQQARFQILMLEQVGANLLLLDEPTDNLDVASAEALERALADFRGTVVAVTHDRWFMREFDRFLLFDWNGAVSESLSLDEVLPELARA
jgi:ATPase subunit of ABC transporter with duplicated ATPase domains